MSRRSLGHHVRKQLVSPSPLCYNSFMKKEDIYFQAMRTRDYRFDGKFFVGVKTTGIYCRPICPAQPRRENVEFYPNHLEAEKAGYRPCMRCRPESAPMSPVWIGKSAIVQRAIKVLNTRDTLEFDEESFAAQFGVSARHLRRLFIEEVGKTPKQLSFENRLNLSRKLIIETTMTITDIAFAAGFASIRRFNDAFKERFKKTPREFRRGHPLESNELTVSLSYRPPFDFKGLLKSYEAHRIGQLEWFNDESMHRVICFNNKIGKIAISDDPKNSSLLVKIDFPDTSAIHLIVSRVRKLFDLDSDPVVIANALEQVPELKKLIQKHPGIRLPSGWEPFEVAISTILGQLVSIERGRNLVNDLIEIAGTESDYVVGHQSVKLFPTPQQIIKADLSKLKTTQARKQTLKNFAQAIVKKELSLEMTQDVDQFITKALLIKGIGPWTAQYMALKVLRDTNVFPWTDLILARTLSKISKEKIESLSPWKGYAAALLWKSSLELKK